MLAFLRTIFEQSSLHCVLWNAVVVVTVEASLVTASHICTLPERPSPALSQVFMLS